MRLHISLVAVTLAACSVERMPALRAVHHGTIGPPHRVVLLPSECNHPWCAGMDAIVAAELSFRGVEIVDLAKLPAIERARSEIRVSTQAQVDGASTGTERRTVTIVGSTYSEVDMWTQRAALASLGVDGIVRIRAAQMPTWPRRSLALVRITRPADAALIVSSVCELEVSRLDGEAVVTERALRCALQGLAP